MRVFNHFKCEWDEKNILWVYFDKHDTDTNTLDREVLDELEEIIENLMATREATGVVIASAKKNGFIAGADIKQFRAFQTQEEGFEFIRHGQIIFSKLAALKIPSVAMIHGFCMGGGLELALACHYRVALQSPKTQLGLPEVMLGIHPGWGGTVRLPALIGGAKAMSVILSGKSYKAKEAKRLGFVDDVVPERYLKKAALFYVAKGRRARASLAVRLSNTRFVRPLIAVMVKKQLSRLINAAHYPAPFAALATWKKNGVGARAMLAEAESITQLFMTPTCHNLIRVFFLREQLKNLSKQHAHAKTQHVHVIGAGIMGGDIAAWCAFKGMRVTLQDQTPERIAPAIKRAQQLFAKKCSDKRDQQLFMDRLLPDVAGHGVAQADVIIEAIFEDLSAKRALFADLEARAKPTALLASNTSSILLEDIATVLKDPSRLVGIHFFNPVAKMMLVEVIESQLTQPQVMQQALAFVGELAKLALPVKSSPGFLVNRVLMPYLMEAMQLHKEGVPITVIDRVAKNFGMPMGPVTLADTVGLDICLSVAKNLSQHAGLKVPEELEQKVKAGQLGVKSGEGFYKYDKQGRQKALKAPHHVSAYADVENRLLLVLLNEAVACLAEGIVQDADQLDAGLIFGAGFAPFTGGPLHYARAHGVEQITRQLHELAQTHGELFRPHPYWSAV